ncbi:replication initiator protein A (plasmid) [Alkalibacillus sp. S2W]|uniref:replication initiator protein A n=1 Tax=Alkalibacillus sp. S2W TaxID=3386553 RepID=UPI00398D184B
MAMEFYNLYEEYGLKHYQLPKVFFTNPDYIKMSNDAKLAWAILRDRFSLSKKNGWYDQNHNIYFVYTNEELGKILGCGKEKVNKIKKELEKNELMYQHRLGLGKTNRLYLGKPQVTDNDIYLIDKNEDIQDPESFEESEEKKGPNPVMSTEVRKSNLKKFENRTSRSSKIEPQEVRKSNTSNTEYNYTEYSETELNFLEKVEKKINNTTYQEIIKSIIEKMLIEYKWDHKTINHIIDIVIEEQVFNFTSNDFDRQIEFMNKQIKKGEAFHTDEGFARYLVNGLKKSVKNSKLLTINQEERKKETLKRDKSVYYDWLDE